MPQLMDYKSTDFFAQKAKKAHTKASDERAAKKNIFELLRSGSLLPEKGIIFHFTFLKGKCHGVGQILLYDRIEKLEFSEVNSKIDLLAKGKNLYFAIEDPTYAFRLIEPHNRTEQESHIPFTAGQLKVMPTFNEGRAFIQDTPNEGVYHYRLNEHAQASARIEEYSLLLTMAEKDKLQPGLMLTFRDKIDLFRSDAEFLAEELSKRILQS